MSEPTSPSRLKWAVALGLIALAACVLVWRLRRASRGATAPTMIACQACDFRGQADVPIGFADWPFKCPKCHQRKALPAVPCPRCGKLFPSDPKAPPTQCPHCKAPLAADDGP